MENNVVKFINEIKSSLGETINQSGTAFYSNITTLTKGKYLIVGLNPGGDPNVIRDTIENSFLKFKNENYNAYFENWYNNASHVHRLQLNLQKLFKVIENDENYLKTVCATNLFYERTKKGKNLNFTNFPKYKKLIKEVLNIVQPEIIFTFGKKPFNTLKELFDDAHTFLSKPSGHGSWKISLAFGKYNGRSTKLIGFPHLSIYTLYTRTDQIAWIKQFCYDNSFNK